MIKLKRFGIYYLPRHLLEEGLSSKIKKIKHKIKNSDDSTVEILLEKLKKLEASRPCFILKIYKANIIVIPITSSDADETNIKIESITKKYPHSYAKMSVLKTMDKSFFIKKMERSSNIKLPQEDIDKILDFVKEFYAK